MKTIYNTYIPITSQEQANEMREICIENGLPIWEYKIAFKIVENKNYFGYSTYNNSFGVFTLFHDSETPTTKEEFIELLKIEKL